MEKSVHLESVVRESEGQKMTFKIAVIRCFKKKGTPKPFSSCICVENLKFCNEDKGETWKVSAAVNRFLQVVDCCTEEDL